MLVARREAQGAFVSVGVHFAPLVVTFEPKLAVGAALLDHEDLPRDPAERMIYATARSTGARLITKDQRLREFDPRGTLW